MRRSHEGLRGITKDNYSGLPENLKEFNYYYNDGMIGHVIMAIPECVLDEAIGSDMDLYESPIPCKYVLEMGYRIVNNHVIVDCNYSMNCGVVIDDEYYEVEMSSPVPVIAVGNPFPKKMSAEGVYFEYDSKATLYANYFSPTEHEIEQFGDDRPIEIRLVVVEKLLFILAKVGDLPWVDAPFNPRLSLNIEAYQQDISDGMEIPLCIYLIDAVMNILRSQRSVRLDTKFSRELQNSCRTLLSEPMTVNEYNDRLKQIYAQYSTEDLVRLSKIGCVL